ncbi:MAG: MoxR family ATPase [Polyangiales bacterium]
MNAPLAHEVAIGPRLQALLELAYRARRPALVEGPTGIGKSELVHHVARSLGISLVTLDLSLLEPPDLVGLPVVRDGRTSYATPATLPVDGAGILLLEELNRAERYVQQPALQLLTARRLHEYELPPDWVCFAVTNPPTGEYHVTPLDRALEARFLKIRARAERGPWLAWAETHGVHPAVLSVVREHSRALDEVCPRSWTFAGQILAAMTAKEKSDADFVRDALCGYLPPSWAEVLGAASEGTASELGVTVRDVLGDYVAKAQKSVREMKSSGRTDALDELVSRVRSVLRSPEIAAMHEQGSLRLESFEALLGDLHGDAREALQEAIASNPVAQSLLELRAGDVIANGQATQADRKIAQWAQSSTQRYRAAIMANALCAHLKQHGRVSELRQSNAVRANLGRALAALGERYAMPLVNVMLELQITPIRPGSR